MLHVEIERKPNNINRRQIQKSPNVLSISVLRRGLAVSTTLTMTRADFDLLLRVEASTRVSCSIQG